MVRHLLVLVLISCLSPELFAQEKKVNEHSPWSFGINGYYGALFRYRQGTSMLNFTDPYGIELYANLQTTGKRLWERQYKYPQIGFAFSYYNYGVPKELGEAYSLTSYLDKAIFSKGKNSLSFNLGTGVVYSTKYYIPKVNEFNKAIGSKISFALRGTIRYELALSEEVFLNFNLAFRHFSNGSLNKPNNGMNFPLIGAGLRYQRDKVKFISLDDTGTDYDRGIQFNLKLTTGRKEVLLVDEKHAVYNISMYASKRFTPINAVLVGADALYDTSLKNEFINIGLKPPAKIDPKMAGITLGHELYLGKMSFVFQLGRYVYQPHKLFPGYYQRYGLQYLITKNLSVNTMLIAHTRTADFVELGIGLHL